MIPVSTTKELLAAVKTGGPIGVNPGNYGAVVLAGLKPALGAALTCAPGAHFESIKLIDTDNVRWTGPEIFPLAKPAVDNAFLFDADVNSSGIVLENALIMSRADARNYRNWTATDWLATKKVFGVYLRGPYSQMVGCQSVALRVHGQISGSRSVIASNKMRGTSNDMIHAIGHSDDYRIFNNDMADFVLVDKTHNDGIQSWSTDAAGTAGAGLMTNVMIFGNLIREWIGTRHPLCKGAQGITNFKGDVDGLTIRNNEIWNGYGRLIGHGITVEQCRNVLIELNRVMNFDRDQAENSPWIMARGSNITIRNNQVAKVDAPGAVQSGNVKPNYATAPMMSLAD